MANRPLEHDTQIQDAATPLNSAGSPYQKYRNAAGGFDFPNAYEQRKVKSRKDSSQPKGSPDKELPDMSAPNPKYAEEGPMKAPGGDDNATDRYFGSFSIEAKRNVEDLLRTHPEFGNEGKMRINRVKNNTREVLPNDPTKVSEVGGSIGFLDEPQASQKSY